MAFSVPPLSYAFDALEPHIDAQTMEIHHDKHHQAYVDKANAALEGTALADAAVEDILRDLSQVPEDKRKAVKNNAGGHHNHTLFWESMSPNGGGEPTGELAEAINAKFGSFADLQAKIKETGVNQFGSGWSWLVTGPDRPRSGRHRQSGQPSLQRPGAAGRRRRLGARLLPQVPEPPSRLHRRLVERGRLGRRRAAPRGRLSFRNCA